MIIAVDIDKCVHDMTDVEFEKMKQELGGITWCEEFGDCFDCPYDGVKQNDNSR